MTFHRWVRHEFVPDWLRMGWMALPSLEGTPHGFYSAHIVWLCGCACPTAVPSNDRGEK